MNPEEIIKRALILTEKGTRLREEENTFLFEVDRRANKIQIRDAIETLFNVSVTAVRTMVVRGRLRRMGRGHAKGRNWKKAMVSLKEGDSIEVLGGA